MVKKTGLLAVFCGMLLCPVLLYAANPVTGPAPAIFGGGGNLTSASSNFGGANNAMWTSGTSGGRTASSQCDQYFDQCAATLDMNSFANGIIKAGSQRCTDMVRGCLEADGVNYNNCYGMVLRCASPKCKSGGCGDSGVATGIADGCMSSLSGRIAFGCKQFPTISSAVAAALAADSAGKAQQAEAAAISAQTNQQMAMMQQQMEQMNQQVQMAQQQAASQVQEVLAAQAAQQQTSVSQSDLLARATPSGELLTKLDNINASLATVRKAMQDAFTYAGCNATGDNCTGPKRVAAFKQKAEAFFDPYDNARREVYKALISAQALGVDVNDIYRMLTNSCSVWGLYQTEDGKPDQLLRLFTDNQEVEDKFMSSIDKTGKTVVKCVSDTAMNSGFFEGIMDNDQGVSISKLRKVLAVDGTVTAKAGNETDIEKAKNKCQSTQIELDKDLAKISTAGIQWILESDLDPTKGWIKGSVNPYYALCSTAVYNSADLDTKFVTDEASKAELNRLIASKVTLLTREMQRQYNYLESTTMRFQMQLQKAIARVESGEDLTASASGASGSVSSEDCLIKSTDTDRMYCFNNQLSQSKSLISGKTVSDKARKQLAKLASSINSYSTNRVTGVGAVSGCSESEIKDANQANTCIANMSMKLSSIQDELNKKTTQSSQQNKQFGQ